MPPKPTAKDTQCVNALRVLSAEAIQQAQSGHPGLPLGAAPAAWALFSRHLKADPAKPNWFNRDRFVLSAGHGSALLYSLLFLLGYGLTAEDLADFRQLDSRTPGHPEYGHTPGVEMTTGPLGQGLASAVGMAAAEAHLASLFNKPDSTLVDHFTYVLAGDGCMMEGISYEAASLAGTLKLGKLIVLYDSNNISIEGDTGIAFTENVAARFAALGWQTLTVADGNDVEAIATALEVAKHDPRPSMIEVKTTIGYGCPAKQGMASAHGEPLGEDNIVALRKMLTWKAKPFEVPKEVQARAVEVADKGRTARMAWEELAALYADQYPADYAKFLAYTQDRIDADYLDSDAFYSFSGLKATRDTSAEILKRLCDKVPHLVGGSADLAPSTRAVLPDAGSFSAADYSGRNLHFGVRELAMAAFCNGMALHGGLRPYCATFFVFSDYVKPAARLSALMSLPVLYVLTHDSIGVGEDGPTHQPVEQLAALRSIPNMTVFRPADGRETAAAYAYALTHRGPVALALTRQALPTLEGSGRAALRGGYILREGGAVPDIILIASGSEVSLALKAADALERQSVMVRVVSMPCPTLFDAQDDAYKQKVLPKRARCRLAIEAAAPYGWHKYTGLDGDVLGMEGFGASGPADKLFERFGFTVDNVVALALKLLAR